MPLRLDIDQGTEWLVPFAKKKLRELKDQVARAGIGMLEKHFNVDTGDRIGISACFGRDRIEIRGQNAIGWAFIGGAAPVYGIMSSRLTVLRKFPQTYPDGVSIGQINLNNNTHVVGSAVSGSIVTVWFVDLVDKGATFSFDSGLDAFSAVSFLADDNATMLTQVNGAGAASGQIRFFRHSVAVLHNVDGTVSVQAVTSHVLDVGVAANSFAGVTFDRNLNSMVWFGGSGNGYTATVIDIATGTSSTTPIPIESSTGALANSDDNPALVQYTNDFVSVSAGSDARNNFWAATQYNEVILVKRNDGPGYLPQAVGGRARVFYGSSAALMLGGVNDGNSYTLLGLGAIQPGVAVATYAHHVYDGPAGTTTGHLRLNTEISMERRIAILEGSSVVYDAAIAIPDTQGAIVVSPKAGIVYVTSSASPVGIRVIELTDKGWLASEVQVDPKSPVDPILNVGFPVMLLVADTNGSFSGSAATFGGFLPDGSFLFTHPFPTDPADSGVVYRGKIAKGDDGVWHFSQSVQGQQFAGGVFSELVRPYHTYPPVIGF